MELLSSQISSKVLTVGPDYRNHRGGVGAVISLYSKYFAVFNFIPTYRVGSVFYKSYVFLISLLKLTGRLISDRNIRIVHIHGASKGSFYRKFMIFFISKYIFRKKIVYHIHGGGFSEFYKRSGFFSKWLIRITLNKSDFVITLSQSWYHYFQDNFRIKKLVVLPNIIDYPQKQQRINHSDYLHLLFFGLVCDGKGIFDLLKVIGNNKEVYRKKVRLLIGGNGETQKLKTLIRQGETGEIVDFLGWVDNDKKPAAFSNSDVFILPSYTEGLPISILEAMSYGKAIISTGVGGIPEIVKDNENGILIEPGNLDQIKNAIGRLIDQPELIRKFGLASEQMVQKFLPGEVIKKLDEIYKLLLQI